MLNQIVTLLYQKGYHLFSDEERGILVRETEKQVYIVTLSTAHQQIGRESYERIRMRVEFMAASRYQKPAATLHLIVTEDDMFEESVIQLVKTLENVWLIANENRKIYIFENQSNQFDGLYHYLEEGLKNNDKMRGRDIPFKLTPVNMIIVSLNILYFLYIIVINGGYYAVYDTDIMLKMGALSYDTFISGEWYQIITSIFMHFGISHLLNNMILLTYVGCELEDRIGGLSYFILYLITGICGNFASLWYYNHIGESAVGAGASGAIFGVIGALFVVLLVNRSQKQNLTPKRLLVMAGITIYYGMTTMGVDNAAHIGGLFGGIIGGFLLSKISQYVKLE